jgi:hypothetical protein
MRYVIVAVRTIEGSALLYCGGDGFKASLLQAARFRTEDDARRRHAKCCHCRRMEENGARIEFCRV